MHITFIYRQITSSLKQTTVFVACVVLSLVTLVSLGGFGESVNTSLLRDARKLLAADIVVESGFPFDETLEAELARLQADPGITVARTYTFITIVRAPEGENSLLSELKAVEPGYPFYGEVGLASEIPFREALLPGKVIVGQNLLDRMGMQIGDPLVIGEATLTIADVVTYEPDRPVDFFRFGPRIFLSAADLEGTGLIKLGSRVNYDALLKLSDDTDLDSVTTSLQSAADPTQVEVNTYLTNQSGVELFFENFLTFLSLIGIFTLLLAGIGIQSSLGAFIREREETVAILRTVGANGGFIMRQFLGVASVLGIAGTVIGLVLGYVLQWVFPVIFGPFLPPQVEFTLSARAILEGMLMGFFVVSVFTFLPIYQLQGMKPRFIFRKEPSNTQARGIFIIAQGAVLLFLSAITFRYLDNLERTAYFAIGIVSLVLIVTLLARLVLAFIKRLEIKELAVRQAVRGLFRPRNATVGIIVTLAASLTVLSTIFLIERNLDASLVQAYPDDAPNLFVLDIQPEQRSGIEEILGQPAQFIPLVQARVTAINDSPISQPENGFDGPGPGGGPPDQPAPLGAQIAISYRDELAEGERLVSGDSMFTDGAAPAQVSISETYLEVYPFELGDRVMFEIQGVQLEAEVTSIRGSVETETGFTPNFTFILRENDLLNAPQTIVTAVSLAEGEIAGFQNRVVQAYPNIIVIDIGAAINELAAVVADITTVVRFFSVFSIVAGVLIIISSVLATRFSRIQESVYFKVLGAKRSFVLRVFALENVFLGALSAVLALFLSQVASWLLVTQVFNLSYGAYWSASVILMLFTIVLVTSVGLLASVSILKKKPISLLRESTVE